MQGECSKYFTFLWLSLSSSYWPSGISEWEISPPILLFIVLVHYTFREIEFNRSGRELVSGALGSGALIRGSTWPPVICCVHPSESKPWSPLASMMLGMVGTTEALENSLDSGLLSSFPACLTLSYQKLASIWSGSSWGKAWTDSTQDKQETEVLEGHFCSTNEQPREVSGTLRSCCIIIWVGHIKLSFHLKPWLN